LIGRLWNRGAATRCPPPEDSSNIIGMLHYLNCNQMLYPERPSADPWTSGLLTIALLPIIDYDDAGASGRLDSQRVSSVLYRAFEDAPGIQPVERERLAEILTDLGIGSGRIADPLVAMRVGETVAARMLLVGDLLRGGEFLHLHVRVLECPSSKIVCATNAEGKRDAEGLAKEVPSWMLSRIREFYPLRGRIIETDPEKGQAYLNLGKVDGVRENQRFRVLEDRGPKADREGQMRDEIAELEILRVGERVSHARLATPGVRLEKGMKVELGKIQQN